MLSWHYLHFEVESETLKDSVAGKDWRQKEKGATEDEMITQHHQLNGHETPGDSGGQRGPGMLQSMRSPRVGHNLANEQQQWLRSLYFHTWSSK